MKQKTLNTEMVLVRKSDVDFLVNRINEALAWAEEFMSDKANRNNKEGFDFLRCKLHRCDAYITALSILEIISAEEVADYEEKNKKCCTALLEWFYEK